MITKVVLDRAVTKALRKLPQHVATKLLDWVSSVETMGLETVRKVPGYHDEPLGGSRARQRSIRLSLHWRAFYTLEEDALRVEYVRVIEVNKHNY